MPQFTLADLVDFGRTDDVVAAIQKKLEAEKTFEASDIEAMFPIQGPAAQFIIKGSVVNYAQDEPNLVQDMMNYSGNQFAYHRIAGTVMPAQAARIVAREVQLMAMILLGRV